MCVTQVDSIHHDSDSMREDRMIDAINCVNKDKEHFIASVANYIQNWLIFKPLTTYTAHILLDIFITPLTLLSSYSMRI